MNCKHYDNENGWCKRATYWNNSMPYVEYCLERPCHYYEPILNDINVKTKYKIGDQIWFADYFHDTFCPCKYYGEIYEINIEIDKNQTCIYYWVVVDYNGNKEFEKYSENACFATYEECTKWCEEHN